MNDSAGFVTGIFACVHDDTASCGSAQLQLRQVDTNPLILTYRHRVHELNDAGRREPCKIAGAIQASSGLTGNGSATNSA